MKIGIASDHRGYNLKKYLIDNLSEYNMIDYGTTSNESVDYPLYAFKLGKKVALNEVEFGIAICGSGIGISIACNKVKGIRCAKINTINEAIMTRKDNDANIIALSGDTNKEEALNLVNKFINTKFLNEERHLRRINEIKEYEDNDC